ncbi:formylglycine-generating enzyme family protein [Wenzhouxiangella sp. XN201]|uniref:formylglycine-generating enzyme family protein n=1 Tax=Wenzhouxiangella sp. XN201 TaxID=2710755 RepID=UPI0013CB6C24|nr:formylglycine-generating enzyme family protein [Wenzhouxiangella sp. XN201]NEZ04219.1 formylglycine-generating enzyme family protein [Wenzhouxiangella sp. XN201]
MRYLLLAMSVGFFLLVPAKGMAQESSEEGAEAEEQAEETEDERRVRRLSDVMGEGSEEFDIDFENIDIPQQPVEPVPEVSLPDPQQDERLQTLLRASAFAPNDPDTQAALSDLIDEVESDIRSALAAENFGLARQLVSVVREVEPNRGIIAQAEAAINRNATIGQTLAQAEAALEAGQLTAPPEDNAAELFGRVLELEPENEEAQSGLARTHEAMIEDAIRMAREELDFEGAEARLVEAESIYDGAEATSDARQAIADFREQHIEALDREVLSHVDEGRYDQAEEGITELVALGHSRARIDALEASLSDARLYGSFEPGQQFDDGLDGLGITGPQMVVMPAGSFMMGSPEDEADRMNNEGPQHRVTFDRGFALARTEVTVGQFADFVDNTGYRTDAENVGSSRVYDLNSGRMDEEDGINWRHDYAGEEADDDLPVVHVSHRDAMAYVEWLADRTGRSYRLPSEAEFEYALRAESQTPYWWGSGSPPEDDIENVTGDRDVSPAGARWNVAFNRYSDGHWGPAPAGSLQANPFGLYDMGGNVMEWVADCWHDSFVRAPGDGSAWINPGCERHVIKGASWSSTPSMSRSAFRISSRATSTDMRVGFRVARDL